MVIRWCLRRHQSHTATVLPLLPDVGTLPCGSVPGPWGERFQLPDIVGRHTVVYCGVPIGPRRRVNHRGRRHRHRKSATANPTAGGRKFQHQPGQTIGPKAGQGDCSRPGIGGPGGHNRPLPHMEQAMVEGWSLSEQLHPGHRQLSVPERSGQGRVTQHRPLLGLGVPPRSQA